MQSTPPPGGNVESPSVGARSGRSPHVPNRSAVEDVLKGSGIHDEAALAEVAMTRIGFDSSSLQRALQNTDRSLRDGFRALGSGRRIDRAADDAAGLSIAQRLGALEAALSQGQRNLNDGIGVAQTADGGLDQTGQILGRLRELSVQARNGTLSGDDRAVIQAEFDQLTDEVDRIAASTSFNGRTLLDGSSGGAGAITFEDGVEGGGDISLDLGDQSAGALGIQGLAVDDPAALDAIDGAIDRVSGARAEIGAAINRFRSSIDGLAVQQENVAAAKSRIADVDVAKAAAELVRDRIVQQGQLGLAAQGNLLAQNALALLR
jgi:flagellin